MDIEETIKRVKTGDTTALKKLIEAYSPMLRKVCFNITHEDEDALNDLVQVAFIRAYYFLHQLRDASKFGEWVSAIAKNEALKFRKCKQKRSVVPFSSFSDEELDVEGSITPENYLGEKEIMDIVRQLPTGYSKVFQMAVIEGVFPHVRATTSLDEVLTDEDIKGVFVSVSSKAHFSIASRVLAHKKALFIEKPPCLNAEELRRLIELQKQTQVLAVVDLQKRFAPAMQILKKKLQGSKGTKTYNLKFLTGAYPEGDALLDLFIHPIDCVVYLFGKAEVRCVEPIDEHTVMLVLKHADAIGVLELSTDYTWSDAKESMTINTNKGIYSLEQMETLTFQRKPHRFCGLPLEKVLMHVNVTAELFGRNNFQPLMQNNQVFTQGYYTAIKSFVDAVEGKRACNPQSLEAFMDTYSLLDTIRLHICRKVF